MPNFISEDQIEQALLQRLQHVCGFDVLECHTADPADLNDGSGRADKRDVLLPARLKAAALKLNPHIPEPVVDSALARLADRRQAMSLVAANREVDGLLRDGIAVNFEDAKGQRQQEQLRLIDFSTAGVNNNAFLAVTQLWIKSTGTTALADYRRPDVLLYVNGIPLVFVELKNSNVKLKAAYGDNLTNYKHDIPQLFITNAFCVLSNAVETRLGSLTGQWEHFFGWLRVHDEKEKVDRAQIAKSGTSLERLVEGLLQPARLLDYVENFVLFHRETNKILAQNHQFIGVNHALAQFEERNARSAAARGKLGVFWHTQGSGKSFSMVFYVRKIFRKVTGNYTFVVVTDRDDLDGQIYRNFLNTGTVKPQDAAQPKNSEELRKFLGQNKRLVFTLIQKFRFAKGATYPVLSERDDIVVIVDEAHRTQYKSLAENMRAGLPNASYLAFTGTPLLGRERKTNEWFGDYVSEYTFQQSMEDGATVPLFYQKRVPEMQVQNEDVSEEFYQIIEDENLDDASQEKLEKRFATEMQVITRDDRLETIAQDIVFHFPRRGYLGKGMVVSVDKFTAVKMFDKVQWHWKAEIKALLGRIGQTPNEVEKLRLKKTVEWMRKVEMAVVISEEAGEEQKFADRKLDIKPHRERMNRLDTHMADIEGNFKDEAHPLQLVFVCAMWLTGFDAPTLSTLYLDKPMKDHTLMQTIARANRVTPWQINGVEKRNGEIVDYYNVFRNMKKALKDYAQGEDGLDEPPVRDKAALFALLDDAMEQALTYCAASGVKLREVLAGDDVFAKVGLFNEFANTLLGSDELRRSFYVYENTVSALYEACKPEVLGQNKVRVVAALAYLLECSATVSAITPQGIALDRTVFYPLGGGQAGDTGRLVCDDGREIAILDTRKGKNEDGSTNADICHLPAPELLDALLNQATAGEPLLRVGDTVSARIDAARRLRLMRFHTATHLLCHLVPQLVNGCSITPDYARLDFNMTDALDKETLTAGITRLVAAAQPVVVGEISDAELDANPALVKSMSVQPPRGSGRIRTIRIGAEELIDFQPCGGTHVANTAEIGSVIVTKIEKKSATTRRVVLGFGA